ncbi:MAG: helix-turn-helix domain-containing protein [Chitinophagaceae bacterium]
MDFLNIDNRLSAIEKALIANKRVLTFDEGCRYSGFKPSYMYKMTSAGKVPFSKPNGKTIFFDKEKLDEWLLSNSRKLDDQREKEASNYIATH